MRTNHRGHGRPFVRRLRPSDRCHVRRLCCATGLLGRPINQVFTDTELFADVFTSYYTDQEPQSAFVVEHDGAIVGYALACADQRKWRRYMLRKLMPYLLLKGTWRYLTRYRPRDRGWVRAVLLDALTTVGPPSPRSAHLHIDLREGYRGTGIGKELINTLFDALRQQGISDIHGGVWSFDRHRTVHLFRRLGFEICHCRSSAIFGRMLDQPVYALELKRDLASPDWRIA